MCQGRKWSRLLVRIDRGACPLFGVWMMACVRLIDSAADCRIDTIIVAADPHRPTLAVVAVVAVVVAYIRTVHVHDL